MGIVPCAVSQQLRIVHFCCANAVGITQLSCYIYRMTFDDFKKQFEVFNKIDTSEKLAICERQYKEHLLRIEDAAFFEPVQNDNNIDLVNDYGCSLKQFLGIEASSENTFFFLVQPSFAPEYLITLKQEVNRYLGTLCRLEENYWNRFYAGDKAPGIKKYLKTSILTTETGAAIFTLLNKTMIEARVPTAKFMVLDGAVYSLSKSINNQLETVIKHSPDEKSKSGKTITVMENLARIIERGNDGENEQLMKDIYQLID